MSISSQLRPVIKLIDDLKDCGIDSKISLPRIAVIGTQSSGKSSLLESIVGYDFLPRGEGTVTRRPLELRLVHDNDKTSKPYAIFNNDSKMTPEGKIENFERVREKIEEKTNEVAGSKRNIVDEPIILTIYSSACTDLTLVDLPGITRVPMKNSEQSEDIERITTEMTERYISDDKTIILCVIPANSDVSTADSIKLARKHDPHGKRTLGVLTKVDIMDKGTSALSTLKNEVIELHHGYVAVKNRSQADINAKVPVAQALKEEREYFDNHPEYKNLPNVGTLTLSKKLTRLLYETITLYLPIIEKDILHTLADCEKELFRLGDSLPTDNHQKLFYFINKAREVGRILKDLVESKIIIPGKTFQGFADFNIQVSRFQKEKNALFIDSLKRTPITHVILDMIDLKGLSLPGFLPKQIIEGKVRTELEELKIPIGTFIENVKKHNANLLQTAFGKIENISADIKFLLKKKSLDYLEYLAEDTKKFIERFIDIEKGMVWTSNSHFFLSDEVRPSIQDPSLIHPRTEPDDTKPAPPSKIQKAIDFIRQEIPTFTLKDIRENLNNLASNLTMDRDYRAKLKQIQDSKLDIVNLVSEEEIVYFYEKLVRYYSLVNRNLSDTIPKIIASELIIKFYTEVEDALFKSVNDSIDDLNRIQEDPSIQKRRENCKDLIIKLKNSKSVLNGFNSHFILDEDRSTSDSDLDIE